MMTMDQSMANQIPILSSLLRRKEMRVIPTYPISITPKNFATSCQSICILVDGDGDVKGRSKKQQELEKFVKEELVPQLKLKTFAYRFQSVEILDSQQKYVDNFMHYCGCVRVFLSEEAKGRVAPPQFISKTDVELVLQNRTSWANPTLSQQGIIRNQTEHFVHRGAMIYLHHALQSAFQEMNRGGHSKSLSLSLHTQEFPVKDDGTVSLVSFIGEILLHYLYPTYLFFAITSALQPTALMVPIMEKEKKIYANLQMSGCNMSSYHLSWSIISLVECLVSTLLLIIFILAVQFFANTDITLFIVVYGLSTAVMIPIIQIFGLFFTSTRMASLVFPLATFVVTSIWMFVRVLFALIPVTTYIQSALYVLLPPLAFLEFMYNSNLAESQFVGQGATAVRLSWGTMLQGSFPLNPTFSALACILILLVDIIIYQLILMYLQAVVPQEIGIVDKPTAIFTLRFWSSTLFGNTKIEDQSDFHHFTVGEDDAGADAEQQNMSSDISTLSERSDDPLTPYQGIDIVNLFKTYDQQEKDSLNSSSHLPKRSFLQKVKELFRPPKVIAVDGLTLQIPSGQIFALLGANGAGKSTTLKMLTGLISPNFGTARINGYDIKEDMDIIRQEMGICMQEDTVYDSMTGYEQMKLFAVIKGIPKRFVKQEIESKLESVGLWEHRNKIVTYYSGGMKRRLTFALAILGNPSIIILDESTAGTDPANRQRVWKVLQRLKMRPNTTILMTSHSMEEVDVLCDTIAVMKKGKLEVVGSSLLLKRHYGMGYHLVCNVKESDDDHQVDYAAVKTRLCEFLHQHFPELEEAAPQQLQSEEDHSLDVSRDSTQGEEREEEEEEEEERDDHKIRMVLPYSAVHKFPQFLRDLDSRLGDLQIASYGLNIPTLEDVFLRINQEDNVTIPL